MSDNGSILASSSWDMTVKVWDVFGRQGLLETLTHSSEVEWINLRHSLKDIFNQLIQSTHSKFVVCDGQLSLVKGIINIKDFLENYQKEGFQLEDIMQPPIYVVQNSPAFRILNVFKSKKQYIGVVIDEFGDRKSVV
jgi:putative hemolysin